MADMLAFPSAVSLDDAMVGQMVDPLAVVSASASAGYSAVLKADEMADRSVDQTAGARAGAKAGKMAGLSADEMVASSVLHLVVLLASTSAVMKATK